MNRDTCLKIRDTSADEIAKMFAACEASIHQPNYTVMRLQAFMGFHTLACNHLASLHRDDQRALFVEKVREAIEIANNLQYSDKPSPHAPRMLLDILEQLRAEGGAP